LYGDVNGDGRLEVADASAALALAVGLSVPRADVEAADVAPVHPDGTFGNGRVEVEDAVRILRRVVGLEKGAWPGTFSFGFEDGLQGWMPDGTDLTDPPVEWSVTHAVGTAHSGAGSVKLYLNNVNDAGKIWLERPFAVEPLGRYRIRLEFQFGTSDMGDVNLWSVIAGAGPIDPEGAGAFETVGDTGGGEDPGPAWSGRTVAVTGVSGADGVLWVALGVWGTYEVARTYYIDDLRVTIEPAAVEGGASVSGRVVPPAGAVVAAVREAGKGEVPSVRWAVPSPDGRYTISGLEPGEYRVFVSSELASPSSLKRIVRLAPGDALTGLDFSLEDVPSTPKQVDELLRVPAEAGASFAKNDIPIRPDIDAEDGPAKVDVLVTNTEKGTARVHLTLRYPRPGEIAIDEIVDFVELKVWAGDRLVDYVPIPFYDDIAEPLNPDDVIELERSVQISAEASEYTLELVMWGNYE